jgi:Family of unknown function (DUF6152)
MLVVAAPAFAHHSAAAKYDASSPLTLTGTASAFVWRNPHCFLYLDVDAGAFKGRLYVVEMSSAGVLTNAGWSRSRIKPGDTIQISVLPARAGSAAGLCRGCSIRVNGVVTNAS